MTSPRSVPRRPDPKLLALSKRRAEVRLCELHRPEFDRLCAQARWVNGLPGQPPEAPCADLLIAESTPPLEQMEAEQSLMLVDAQRSHADLPAPL